MGALGVLKGPLGRELSMRARSNRRGGADVAIDVEDAVMRYCLFMHYQEAGGLGPIEEDMAPAMAAFQSYADDLSAAGVLKRLGGIFVIEAADLDEALKWVRRNPANGWGTIEIRPLAKSR